MLDPFPFRNKLAKQLGKKERRVRRALEKPKQEPVKSGGGKGLPINPDAMVEPATAEAYPQLPGGR